MSWLLGFLSLFSFDPGAAVLDRAAPAVALVHGPEIAGTAFLLETPGGPVLVTNRHVCGGAFMGLMRAEFEDGEAYTVRVLDVSDTADLCLLKAPPTDARPLELGSDTEATMRLYEIGHPFGTPTIMTEGYASVRVPGDMVYSSIVTYPGNSGSPVLNVAGHVVGVAVMADTRTHYGYYIPVSVLRSFLASE